MLDLFSNLSAVVLLLINLLLGAMLKLRETRAQYIYLLLWLGISFGACAALCCFCLIFLYLPPLVKSLLPLGGLWLPLAWSYTFPGIKEEPQIDRARHAVTENKPQPGNSDNTRGTASELPAEQPEWMQEGIGRSDEQASERLEEVLLRRFN